MNNRRTRLYDLPSRIALRATIAISASMLCVVSEGTAGGDSA